MRDMGTFSEETLQTVYSVVVLKYTGYYNLTFVSQAIVVGDLEDSIT